MWTTLSGSEATDSEASETFILQPHIIYMEHYGVMLKPENLHVSTLHTECIYITVQQFTLTFYTTPPTFQLGLHLNI